MIQQKLQPKPLKGTRVRIYGPQQINGMLVWRLYDVSVDPWRQIGPLCFSYDEAVDRAQETIDGKSVVWFGGRKLVPTPYY